MVICFICKQCFSTVHILTKHFNYNFSVYFCAENGCNRSFHLLNSFKKHLTSHTKYLTIESSSTHELISTQSVSTGNPVYIASNTVVTVSSPQSSNTESELPETQINTFLASLYSNSQIPRNVVQEVMDGINETIGTSTLKKGILELSIDKNEISCGDFFEYLNSAIDNIDKTFINLDTEYKRFKYFTELGTYIPPQEYIIGQRLNESTISNTFSIIPINCTQQFIPIRYVLKKFFK